MEISANQRAFREAYRQSFNRVDEQMGAAQASQHAALTISRDRKGGGGEPEGGP
jgi:hypothetical protein